MLPARNFLRLAMALLAAAILAGCETTGSTPAAQQAAKPAEPPMTRTRAATICWMATEKGHADMNLDKRADVVNKCIDEKMKAVQTAPAT